MKQEGKAKNLTKCWKHKETLSTLTTQIHFSQTRNVVLPPFCPRADEASARQQVITVMKPVLGAVAETPRPLKRSLTLLTHSTSPAPYAHPHPSLRRSWENCESRPSSPFLFLFYFPPCCHSFLNAWSVIFLHLLLCLLRFVFCTNKLFVILITAPHPTLSQLIFTTLSLLLLFRALWLGESRRHLGRMGLITVVCVVVSNSTDSPLLING